MEVGINLFSVRNLIKNEEEFLKTAKELKKMGYGYMQFSGAAYDPQMIARVSKESAMPVCLTHVPMDRIINDTDALMQEHRSFGCKNIGLGMMPTSVILNESEFTETVKKLNEAGKKMKENGFSFFYHNHHFEFYKYKDETALEYIIENAPYINITFDTYWAQYGGGDVYELLDKLRGRVNCVHLKDYKIVWNKEIEKFEPVFAPVGDGNLDFKKIVAKMRDVGTECFLVEQDNAALFDNTMELVKRSVDYIKSNF